MRDNLRQIITDAWEEDGRWPFDILSAYAKILGEGVETAITRALRKGDEACVSDWADYVLAKAEDAELTEIDTETDWADNMIDMRVDVGDITSDLAYYLDLRESKESQ